MNEKILMNIQERFADTDIILKDCVISAGSSVVPHWHDYFESEIIISGHAEQIYNGEKYAMERGCAYLLSYCDFHSFKAIDDVRLLNVRFKENLVNPELLRYITLKPNKLICTMSEEETRDIIKSYGRLKSETENPQIFGRNIISGIISDFIISLLRKTSGEKAEAVPMITQQAAAYINTDFRDKISLALLAEKLSVSVNYLGALFKKHLGASFNDYLNNVRLKYACNLLISSDLSVKEVAYASGYASTEYFTYIFKKKTGVTPRDYRTLLQK